MLLSELAPEHPRNNLQKVAIVAAGIHSVGRDLAGERASGSASDAAVIIARSIFLTYAESLSGNTILSHGHLLISCQSPASRLKYAGSDFHVIMYNHLQNNEFLRLFIVLRRSPKNVNFSDTFGAKCDHFCRRKDRARTARRCLPRGPLCRYWPVIEKDHVIDGTDIAKPDPAEGADGQR